MAHLGRLHISQAQKNLLYGLAGVGVTAGLALQLQPQSRCLRSREVGKYDHLMGTWIRDRKASDSYEHAMNVMQINPLLKTAMRQLHGIRLEQTDEQVVMSMLSRFSWFRLQERYPWSGHPVPVRRRDFRQGKAKGALGKDADSLWIEQVWRDPVGGHGSECAWSPKPGVLYVDSTIVVKGRTAQYRQVYHAKR